MTRKDTPGNGTAEAPVRPYVAPSAGIRKAVGRSAVLEPVETPCVGAAVPEISARFAPVASETVGGPPLTVRCLAHERSADCETLRLGLRFQGREHEVYYRVFGAEITPDPNAWASLALPLAMRLGVPLRLEDPISGSVAACLRQLAEIHSCWYPGAMRLVPLEVEESLDWRSPAGPSGAACFFSGGLDSYYCTRKHFAELTHLIFVHGFDIPLANHALRGRVSAVIRRSAAELGKSLVEVETNIREVMDPHLMWGAQYLGLAMAPIPLLLSGTIRRCYLPSDVSYAETELWGSHPSTTPLLSSPAVQLVHAGAEAEKIDRLRAVVADPVVQRSLRVCWQNVEGEYNCGRCKKCLFTMATLCALGYLDRFNTFPQKLDLDAIARLDCWETVPSWGITLAYVRQQGTDPALERALLAMRAHSRKLRGLRGLWDRVPSPARSWARSHWHRLRR